VGMYAMSGSHVNYILKIRQLKGPDSRKVSGGGRLGELQARR